MHWIDDGHLDLDGSVFRLLDAGRDGSDELTLLKPRRIVERYVQLADEFSGGRVFEAGIFRGGSTAFLAAILDPEKLVAIDIEPERNEWLDTWLEARGLTQRVRMHHGVDQADRDHLGQLVADEFDGRALDLVIDDASHRLTPTTDTFEILFPRLRPGGLYIIEDWSWNLVLRPSLGRRAERLAQILRERPELLSPDSSARLENQMWRLVLRLTLALGTHLELVPEMEVTRGFAALRRGPAELDPEHFKLADWVGESPV